MDALDEETLKMILTKPKNAILKQYKALLNMDGVELEFEQAAIDKIAQESDKIMIIGRNNFDICPYVKNHKSCQNDEESEVIKPFKQGKNNELIYHKNPDLKIKYITVHKSKGLEEDNVILINLENKRAGFPNQIEDDCVLDFVINDSDQYEFGEERRLFYVALTRTKNNVYLMAPDIDKSVFLLELEENIDDLEVLKIDGDLGETLDNRYTLETMKEILLSKCIFAGFNG